LQVKKYSASFRFQAGFLKNTRTTGFVNGVVSAKKECFSKIKSVGVCGTIVACIVEHILQYIIIKNLITPAL
jgi:hypothetical protein